MNGTKHRQQFLDILKEKSIQQSFPLTSRNDFQTHFSLPEPVNYMDSPGQTSSSSSEGLVSSSLKPPHKAYQQPVKVRPSLKLKRTTQLTKHHSNKLSTSCHLSHNNWNTLKSHEKVENEIQSCSTEVDQPKELSKKVIEGASSSHNLVSYWWEELREGREGGREEEGREEGKRERG